MAPYVTWAKTRKVPRVAWVCGPEPILRYDVVDAYRAAFPRIQSFSRRADHDTWDFLLTLPQYPRLTVVWDAQALEHRDRVAYLTGDEFEGTFTVFVSSENDFGKDDPLVPALRDSKHGALIRCCVPRDPESQAQMVASWWPNAGRNIGAKVLALCGGDITAARHAARKAVCSGLLPVESSVSLVCVPGATDDYADRLVACDVKGAMFAAACIDPDQAGAAIGLLSSRLSLLALLGDAVRRGDNVSEFARRSKVDTWLAGRMREHAAAYTPAKVANCRQLLAMAETAWKDGARTGVLEAVASLW